ncbi:MAG: anti-sigma factor domain-containing protein [Alphaproteobacteria bacterium]
MSERLDDLEAVAAEYVLGSLAADERRGVEERLAHDAELARHVELWTERLAPLDEAIPPATPSPGVWRRIERQISSHEGAGAETRPRRGRIWERVGFWRLWAVGASAVAAALAVLVLVTALPDPEPRTRLIAVLGAEETRPAWLVDADPATGELTARPLGPPPGELAERSLELWLIAATGVPPKSLGLLDPARETVLRIAPETAAALQQAVAFAVSLEPAGGSPTGLPTGPVLYQGAPLP